MNPEKHLLDYIAWQFFSTLTLKTLRASESTRLKMFFALVRGLADNFGVHFFNVMWALRREKGEQTDRPHFHALIAGLPEHAVTLSTNFSLMREWENYGGGIARVRVYDSRLAGVEYVLKGIDEAYSRAGANWYELRKFSGACDVMLSMSLIRHVQNRLRFGPRDRDGLFDKNLQPRLLVLPQRRCYSRNRFARHSSSMA